jgi:hypothetical protein
MSVERIPPHLAIRRHSNPDRGTIVEVIPVVDDTRQVDPQQVLQEINGMAKYHVRRARGHSGRGKNRRNRRR